MRKETTEVDRFNMLSQIGQTWPYVPHFSIGELIAAAMGISRGELRGKQDMRLGKEEEILSGLRALIPMEWEGKKA